MLNLIAFDGIDIDYPPNCMVKHPYHFTANIQEALRTRGLKDDTTCIVVDIIPPDHSVLPPSPPRKMNKLKSLIFRKRSKDSSSKLAKKLSAVGIVEELFEEGSAMLAERSELL